MKTTPLSYDDLRASVLAVPPLARDADLRFEPQANQALVRYLEAGGVRTLLYGGNANLYHVSPSEYGGVMEQLAGMVGEDTLLIPSVGPAYGTMMDQAELLRSMAFPTVMVLPQAAPATIPGVATGIRHFAERLGRPVVVYLKQDGYLDVEHVRQLVDDGLVSAIKYAVVRDDPARDPFLSKLCQAVDTRLVVSGIGERPAVVHLRDFGLASFTSGSVCVAPRRSMALLAALQDGDHQRAGALREAFLPLEDLRDGINPIRVLHEAVTLAGIADMGPLLPLLSGLDQEQRARVAPVARALRDVDEAAVHDPVRQEA